MIEKDQIIDIDLGMDKTIDRHLNMVRNIEEEIIGEETIEQHKIKEDRRLEGNIEKTIGIVILIRIEAGQEIDNIQVSLEGIIEIVLGQDQVLE